MKQLFESALCIIAIAGAAIAYQVSKKSATVAAASREATLIASPSEPKEITVQNEGQRMETLIESAKMTPEIEDLILIEETVEKEPEQALPFKLVLPTENEDIFNEPSQFYMYTNRYKDGVNLKPWTGGMYGFSRTPISTQIGTVNTKLHEGMDIRPVRRDVKGEPLDPVYSISDGVVVYVNSSAGRSNYGKYVVVEHDWPDGKFYSLYAHLAKTTVSFKDPLAAGDKIGILGYTGAGINKERAHVHVELAFMASKRFNSSYSPGNGHYNYNGLNLVGMDVARLFRKYNKDPHFTMREFLDEEEPYFTVRTKRSKRPEILDRHLWLGEDMESAPESKSWEVTFARSGVPLSIRPTSVANKYNHVTWVKDSGTNHSYMTSGRLLGSGSKAKLSSKGHRFINLICETF